MDISPSAAPPPPGLRGPAPDTSTLGPAARLDLWPYLARHCLAPPPAYSLERAVTLAEGCRAVPPELLPRIRVIVSQTQLGGGIYLRDMINLCRLDVCRRRELAVVAIRSRG